MLFQGTEKSISVHLAQKNARLNSECSAVLDVIVLWKKLECENQKYEYKINASDLEYGYVKWKRKYEQENGRQRKSAEIYHTNDSVCNWAVESALQTLQRWKKEESAID